MRTLNRAYTLLELIVTLVILGVLASLVIPTFEQTIQRSRQQSTLTTLGAISREAQALHAFNKDQPWDETAVRTAVNETAYALGGTQAAGTLTPVEHSTKTSPDAGEVIYLINEPTVALAMRSGQKVCALVFDIAHTISQGCVSSTVTDPTKAITENPSSWDNSNGETNSGGTDDVPLAVPNIKVSLTNPYQPVLTLTSLGATSFNLQRSVDGGAYENIGNVTGTYTDINVTPGKTYTWKAQALKTATTSPWSNPTNAVTIIPSIPTNLSAGVNGQEVTLTWDASIGATGYSVYRSNGSLVGLSTTATFKSTFPASTSDSVYVKATNPGGASSASTPVAFLTTPGAPENLHVTIDSGRATLTWNPVAGASSYNVTYNGVTTSNASTSFNLDGNPGSSFEVTVNALNATGMGPGATISVTLPPEAPSNLKADVKNNTATLTWDAPDGADGYKVYVDGKFNKIVSSTSTTVDVQANSSVAVEAYNNGGTSAKTFVSASGIPSAPNNLTWNANDTEGATSFNITWDASPGATGYNVYFNSSFKKMVTTSNTTFSLPYDTSGVFSVEAFNTAGTSAANSVTLTAQPTVGSVNASISSGTVSVSWAGSDYAQGYRVAYANADPVNGPFILSTASKSATFPLAAAPGSTTTFMVVAYNSAGFSTTPFSVTVLPQAPSNLSYVQNSDGTSVTVSWDASPGATSYQLTYDGTSKGEVTGTSYVITGVTFGSHVFQVKAAMSAGSSGASSLTITPLTPLAPQNVSATGGDQSISVSWQPPANAATAGVDGYVVSTDTGLSYLTNDLSYSFTNITPGVHSVTVAAKRGSLSGPATSISVTVNAPMTLAYAQSTFTTASQQLSPTTANANKPVSYSYTGTLPSGVSFNSSNGVFTGPASWSSSTYTQVEPGQSGSVAAVDPNGDVWVWGYNNAGVFGGLASTVLTPTKLSKVGTPAEGLKFIRVMMGYGLLWAQTADGKTYVYGNDGTFGNQVGIKNAITLRWAQMDVNGATFGNSKIDNALSTSTSALYLVNGHLYAGGMLSSSVAKTGGGYTMPYDLTDTAGNGLYGKTVVKIQQESSGYLALTSSGEIYVWGLNTSNVLGAGSVGEIFNPVKVLSGVSDFWASGSVAFAKMTDGTYSVWGSNGGYFGNGSTSPTTSITPRTFSSAVFTNDPIVNMTIGGSMVTALTQNAKVYTWGPYGSLTGGQQLTPVERTSSFDGVVNAIKAGDGAIVASTNTGNTYLWGSNSQGQFGNGTTTTTVQATPQKSTTFGAPNQLWPFITTVTATDANNRQASATVVFTLG